MSRSPQNVISRLHKMKDAHGNPYLDVPACKAALQLEQDFCQAGVVFGLTANWSEAAPARKRGRKAGNRQAIVSDARLDAQDRYYKALWAVGPEFSGLLTDICCFHQSLVEAETMNGWPKRSGKLVLKLALARLARHYGLVGEPEEDGPATYRPLCHWGTPDYRPKIR